MAQLDALAFEGATKRSKPNLKVRMLLTSRRDYERLYRRRLMIDRNTSLCTRLISS